MTLRLRGFRPLGLIGLTGALLLALGLTAGLAPPVAAAGPLTAYLMVHFSGESATGEQIYLATSTDGLRWTDLNDSRPVLTSTERGGTQGITFRIVS